MDSLREPVTVLLVSMACKLLSLHGCTAQQIEAVRVTMSRKLKKVGLSFCESFPDKPITKKPAETRMGKGKGNVEILGCCC